MNDSSLSPTSGPVIRTTHRGRFGYQLARATLGRVVRLLYRVEVHGLDRVPDRGPVILTANHRSFMDSVFLALTSPRPVSFLAKAEYFQRRLADGLHLHRTDPIATRKSRQGTPSVGRRHRGSRPRRRRRDLPGGNSLPGRKSRRGHRGPALLAATPTAAYPFRSG